MKYPYLYISILISLLSCKDNKEQHFDSNVERSSDTIYLEHYENNPEQIKEVRLRNGTIEKYYDNGMLFLRGRLNNENQRAGEWSFFTKEGKLSETREYYIINKEPYLNQNIYFSKNDEYWTTIKEYNFNVYNQKDFYNDTLNYTKSYFAEFDLGKDTININEPWRAVSYYYTPIYKDKNSEVIIVMGRTENNFNADFSNFPEVEKDTFYSLKKDVGNQRYFPDDDPNSTVVFGTWFKTPGKKILRGYLSEYYKDSKKRIQEKRIFFEKNLFVKDSL